MNHDRPTIALVHGAFADSSSWNGVIERLHAADPAGGAGDDRPFRAVLAISNPLRSLSGDAAYVRDVLGSVDGPIVLVGHSYGGMVITEAAADIDGVVGLVYVGAFTPDHGESAFQLSTLFPGSTLGDALTSYPVSTGGMEVAIRPEVFHDQFAADVAEAQTALMAVTQRPATLAALSEPLPTEQPAWKGRPCWCIYGDQDRNIPAELQRFMAPRAGARRITEIAGGSHAIAVSQPAAVAATILEAVKATTPATAAAS